MTGRLAPVSASAVMLGTVLLERRPSAVLRWAHGAEPSPNASKVKPLSNEMRVELALTLIRSISYGTRLLKRHLALMNTEILSITRDQSG